MLRQTTDNYIITEINKNDLLTPESKAKLVKAIEAESVEYQKLLESLTDVTSETKVLLEKKESDDMSWGTIALYTLGAVLAIGKHIEEGINYFWIKTGTGVFA